jgi:16S rRNA (guanine1516-N2)-methyltransferase
MVQGHQSRLQQLADYLQLPIIEAHDNLPEDKMPQYVLTIENHVLGIKDLHSKAGLVAVDFEAGGTAHRRNQGRGELIVKAMGGCKQRRPTILDVTAGLGRDSFVLASWGFPVNMLERSKIVASLLADGLVRAQSSANFEIEDIASQMSLTNADSIAYLSALGEQDRPDVIYMDPMFPISKKSALVKKDMQVFHAVVGKETDDGVELFTLALEKASYRVVVKRPKKAQYLAGKKPNYSLEGKAVRFDVYTIKAFSK